MADARLLGTNGPSPPVLLTSLGTAGSKPGRSRPSSTATAGSPSQATAGSPPWCPIRTSSLSARQASTGCSTGPACWIATAGLPRRRPRASFSLSKPMIPGSLAHRHLVPQHRRPAPSRARSSATRLPATSRRLAASSANSPPTTTRCGSTVRLATSRRTTSLRDETPRSSTAVTASARPLARSDSVRSHTPSRHLGDKPSRPEAATQAAWSRTVFPYALPSRFQVALNQDTPSAVVRPRDLGAIAPPLPDDPSEGRRPRSRTGSCR